MSALQFALFSPLLLFVFWQGAKAMNQSHCRSLGIEAVVKKELETTVAEAWALPIKFSLNCGFILTGGDGEHEIVYPTKLESMKVKYKLSTGVDYE